MSRSENFEFQAIHPERGGHDGHSSPLGSLPEQFLTAGRGRWALLIKGVKVSKGQFCAVKVQPWGAPHYLLTLPMKVQRGQKT